MKKIKLYFLIAFLSCGICGVANAGVTFLPSMSSSVGGGGYNNNNNNTQTPEVRCRNEGYRVTSCARGLVLRGACPYSRSYYKNCCQSEYNYSKAECERAGMTASRSSCGGYYKCL